MKQFFISLYLLSSAFACSNSFQYGENEQIVSCDTEFTDNKDSDFDTLFDSDNTIDSDSNPSEKVWDPPLNVILFIGDGMGHIHVDAGSMMKTGNVGSLVFESFPVFGWVTNHAANAAIPDSAASATAIATGVKVDLKAIAVEVPGDGHALPTLVDFYQHEQKSTALVTTCSITDATPAAFGGHSQDRYNNILIAWHYINTSRPNILFGGGGNQMILANPEAAGYTVINSLIGFDDLSKAGAAWFSGQFGEGDFLYEADGIGDLPHLHEMTIAALSVLMRNPKGYFMMSEGGLIDDASHVNDIRRTVGEVLEFDKTVEETLAVIDLSNTLVIVTADHATGGLEIAANNGKGNLPSVTWATADHNEGMVPLYAIGKGSEVFQKRFDKDGFIDNTDIYHILTKRPQIEI